MGWNSEEEESNKSGMKMSSKILIAIIICLIVIISLIGVLMIYIQTTSYKVYFDGEKYNKDISNLSESIDGVTYIQIEEFAKLVKYDYHKGEYKNFTIEEDKCYVQNKNETASFYLNDNKVCKLPIGKVTEDYRVYEAENTVKELNGKMYATIDAIQKAFNVQIYEGKNSLTIFTLEYLVSYYNDKVTSWGYASIADQAFENTKSILYNCLIVKKEDGLYKIINLDNTKEIVSDKYSSIEFIENTQEFFVTNSLNKVGIINLDGSTKIDPEYNSIEVLDKESELYLIKENGKCGVVRSGNITIIYPEYDSIGLKVEEYPNHKNSKYVLLDKLIPVCKGEKYGAFDKDGNLILKLEYNGFGCNKKQVEIGGIKKDVNPVLTIERCNGIVVKKGDKYGIKSVDGKDLVSINLDNIYSVENEDKKIEYYMLYKNTELNIIEELIKAKLIEEENDVTNTQENTSIQNNNNTAELNANNTTINNNTNTLNTSNTLNTQNVSNKIQ